MKGSAWVQTVQAAGIGAVQRAVIDAVRAGQFVDPARSKMVATSRLGQATLQWQVMRLPLAIGEPDDFVFAPVSSRTADIVAQHLGMLRLTTKMMEDLWRQGPQVDVCTQPPDPVARRQQGFSPAMNDAKAAAEWTRDTLKSLEKAGLEAPVLGKAWPVTNTQTTADKPANFGAFSNEAPYRTAAGSRLWQPLSHRHNSSHFDYSQVLTLAWPTGLLNGQGTELKRVAADPELAGLLSTEGVVKAWNWFDEQGRELGALPESRGGPLSFAVPLGMGSLRTADVKLWQQFLKVRDDGAFGRITAAATKEFQAGLRISPTGFVDGQTLAAANAVLEQLTSTDARPPISMFVQAKNYLRANRAPSAIRRIVLHTAEIAETATSAEALVSAFGRADAPKASFHYAIDSNSIAQGVREEDVAYHAPGCNHDGIGIEMSGRAAQTPAQWADDYSGAMLALTAKLTAYLCRKYDIPVEMLSAEDLVAGKPGITTHAAVSKAFKKSTHWDPGPGFPTDSFLKQVRAELGSS